jgi:hypothetical protein
MRPSAYADPGYLLYMRDNALVAQRFDSRSYTPINDEGRLAVYSNSWERQQPGVRVRAEHLYQQLDSLQPLRLEARRELLRESHKHAAVKLLCQIPSIGPIRSALLVALLQTPQRFRSKRQLWAYSGFAVETHDSGEYRCVRGKLQRNRERITVRGLNDNHNKDLKSLFKSAAMSASTCPGPLPDFYVALVAKGIRPTMARLTLARKIAAITVQGSYANPYETPPTPPLSLTCPFHRRKILRQ